jgi:putative transposase
MQEGGTIMTDLKTFIQTTRDSRELKRALAVKNTLAGRPWQEVADELLVCRAFIGKWRKIYVQEGVDGLRLRYKGSTGYLSAARKAEILAWIQDQEQWSVTALRTHILYKYGVRYKSRQSYYALLTEARMSWKKSQDRHPKANPEAVAETREQIKKKRARSPCRSSPRSASCSFSTKVT